MNNVNIGYQSKVILKGRDKFGNLYSFNTHNEILPAMQLLFSRALTGYDISQYIPVKVDLTNGNDSVLTNLVPLTGKHTEAIQGEYVAILTATIYAENIRSGAIIQGSTLYLQLSSSEGSYMNKVVVPEDIVESLMIGTSLVIEWQIKLVDTSNVGD